jgi:hypothetical protein
MQRPPPAQGSCIKTAAQGRVPHATLPAVRAGGPEKPPQRPVQFCRLATNTTIHPPPSTIHRPPSTICQSRRPFSTPDRSRLSCSTPPPKAFFLAGLAAGFIRRWPYVRPLCNAGWGSLTWPEAVRHPIRSGHRCFSFTRPPVDSPTQHTRLSPVPTCWDACVTPPSLVVLDIW